MANNFEIQKNIESELVFGERENDKIDLSIVIPTYKRIDLLKKTIVSILNQKKDCGLEIEVIVVSNDTEFNVNSLDLMLPSKKFYIYRNKENLGMVGNMNRCAVLSRGTYVSYIQDDDVLLPNYLKEISKLIKEEKISKIDCIIPNRYIYCGNDTISQKREYRKEEIIKLLSGYRNIPLLQKIGSIECGCTWYNCFGGGPTCGILFRKHSLMESGGFSFEYPFAFDYVFFLQFSSKYTTCLFNKYLSIYRTTDSATNRPEVQVDFFKSDMFLLDLLYNRYRFVTKYRNEIINFSVYNKSEQAKKLILKEYEIPKINRLKYTLFRFKRIINAANKKLYRLKIAESSMEKYL